MMVIDLALNIGVVGVVPWQRGGEVHLDRRAGRAPRLGPGRAPMDHRADHLTAFASVFTGLLGAPGCPSSAARERLFFSPFGRLHPRLRFPHISLLVMGAGHRDRVVLHLTTVINMLTAVVIWVSRSLRSWP